MSDLICPICHHDHREDAGDLAEAIKAHDAALVKPWREALTFVIGWLDDRAEDPQDDDNDFATARALLRDTEGEKP